MNIKKINYPIILGIIIGIIFWYNIIKCFADIVRTQVIFTEKTELGEYTDALYFNPEEYAKLKQDDIDMIKKECANNWVNSVKNAPAPKEPTKEELEAQVVEIDEQIIELGARKQEINIKIEEIKNK